MTPERFKLCQQLLPDEKTPEYVESKGLIPLTSAFLLSHDCCIFHGVSFLFRDNAWIFTAPSGTGKTTQFVNWKKKHPEEVQIICGDMPLLEKKQNNIIVHPTPWNGKEKMGGYISASLRGIVILEQGNENIIKKTTAKDGIYELFRQFVFTPETKEEILTVTALIEFIFSNCQVYQFINTGDSESTELLRAELGGIWDEDTNKGRCCSDKYMR